MTISPPLSRPIAYFLSVFLILYPEIALSQISSQLPLDRILEKRDFEKNQKILEKRPSDKETRPTLKEHQRTSNYCVEVEKIEFSKTTKLNPRFKKELSEKHSNKCIYNDEIGSLINEIINNYVNRGYISARAYFDGYNYQDKILKILILEGKIGDIRTDKKKDSIFDKSRIFFAFPTSKGNILNIKDIEQGVTQMNRLGTNNVSVDSKPSEKEGITNIIIKNQKSRHKLPIDVSVNYDNSGSKSSGVYNTNYSLNADNLLSVNDNIDIGQIKSDRSETNMFNISIPFGYYTFNYSDFSNKYRSFSNLIKIEGRSTNHNFNIERVLYKNDKNEINVNSSLNLRNQTRKIAEVIDIKSQRISTARVGMSYLLKMDNNLTIFNKISYSKGLKIHSAIDDKKDFDQPLTKDSPRAQFEKFSYNLNANKIFAKYFDYSLQANIQHSSDALYSSELIFVGGGKYSVRGFQYSGIGGSKGGYIRNDLSFNLPFFMEEKLKNKSLNNVFLRYGASIIKSVTPFIFYDHGYARAIEAIDENEKTEYISGAGFGLKLHANGSDKKISNILTGEISYAKGINSPNYVIASNDYQNSAIYFGVNLRMWVW